MKKQNQLLRNRIPRVQNEVKNVCVFYKDGDSTMLFLKAPYEVALMVEHHLKKILKKYDVKLKGIFIYTQGK